MPLHLSLGIGLQFLNIAENVAVSLDIQVRDANGLTSDGIIESYNKQCELEAEIQLINDDVAFTREQIEIFFKQKREIESDKPQHFEKDNGRLKDLSQDAKNSRKQVATVNKDVKMLEEKLKNLKKSLVAKEGELSDLNKFINGIKGPFKSRSDDCMHSLKLKRQVCHSGALVGNDTEKVHGKRYKVIRFEPLAPVQTLVQGLQMKMFIFINYIMNLNCGYQKIVFPLLDV